MDQIISVEETEKPVCPKDGLLLKIMAVGLCGSDIRNLTTDSGKGNYPFIYSHEIVGFVDEMGSEQTKYSVGDRLFLFPETYCMECDKCISGHSENCSIGGVSKGSMTELDCNLIHYNNIWIKGHFGASYSQSKHAFQLAISPNFPTKKFVTHILPLDQINEGIQLTKTSEAIKVVLHPFD